ncbi:hypothetical protein H920_01287 [Fukomys damarensis]|uniref:Uncharacterized protein n=1 Tax=Fukomys damarensis TaxID=885580 RepID=A0A091E431_FUKDA|nr:hypothetical protein H920_01287 [Fukomys damarensis]
MGPLPKPQPTTAHLSPRTQTTGGAKEGGVQPVLSRVRHGDLVLAAAAPRAFLSLLSPTTNRKCVTRRPRGDVNFRPALTPRMRERYHPRRGSYSFSSSSSLREGSRWIGGGAFLGFKAEKVLG